MLIKCPECDLQVSDHALACPHCGYPMRPSSSSQASQPPKRRRLPNGFGQISEIKNRNLRNPYRAMVSIGKTETGRPICKPLKPKSYFATYNDAYRALVEYNKNPYDQSSTMTMQELYDKWSLSHFKHITGSSIRSHETSWNYCSAVYNMRVVDIRPKHILDCMENGKIINQLTKVEQSPGPKRQVNIKSLFNVMLDYAVQYGVVDHNYARDLRTPKDIQKTILSERKSHIPFTDEEMNILWNNRSELVDTILLQCYMGWRPSEICSIRLENITPDITYITGGSKTEAGKNRRVPIHSKILEIVKHKIKIAKENGSEYLINCENTKGRYVQMRYDKYSSEFLNEIIRLGLNPIHRPHDCRKQFITMAKKYNVDEYAIKYMVGHAISDLTERIYTERDPNWLKTEIEKIK